MVLEYATFAMCIIVSSASLSRIRVFSGEKRPVCRASEAMGSYTRAPALSLVGSEFGWLWVFLGFGLPVAEHFAQKLKSPQAGRL